MPFRGTTVLMHKYHLQIVTVVSLLDDSNTITITGDMLNHLTVRRRTDDVHYMRSLLTPFLSLTGHLPNHHHRSSVLEINMPR